MPTAVTPEERIHLVRALKLAESGRGAVSPNPMVGCVLVRDGDVIGEGWHAELGGLHAERAALANCAERGNDAAGATVYVTLEPCAHEGRQPPCSDALIEARVARVVYLSDDPSEKAGGRGPGMLRDAGIEVDQANGPEAAAARLLIQPFRKHARTGRPLVTLKSALTLDGRTATALGDSKWISGPQSRALVHSWRAEMDSVAIGIGTALADNALLTARDVEPPARHQPTRVVFDSAARLPADSALATSTADAPVLLISSPDAPPERVEPLRAAGVDVLVVDGDPVARALAALTELGRRGITSLLVEGGAGLAGSFVDAGEVDELRLFIAPILLGGATARPLAGGEGKPAIADAERALAVTHETVGDDLLITARMREW
ncbi:MAG TPA: bifunctional diaminohydroxyphosphoribosylaminopyrimidine deaminase/5-amino-6-(5-phosphoribosylamino)uracil reductase RibD [Solirubrobacterales bacterium]|nr:bifunctional diaminohydroxyphosphoribosylaminopyrimidine deaminase/5-amino-6-(5-phosphoribosylamino)uracil reductase RibD [Solirubrobacterales bacterium]